MIVNKVKVRISVKAGTVNTGSNNPRKWISDKLKIMLKEFIDANKEISILLQVEKDNKVYREYYKLN